MNFIKKWVLGMIINNIVNRKGVKQMFEKIKAALSGQKTYIVALSAIIGVLIAWVNGTLTDVEAVKAIIEAILAITIRAGVSKT